MHWSALRYGSLFFETYCDGYASAKVVDVGSQDVNGSLRAVCPPAFDYTGMDVAPGNGVDVVLEDPYVLPLPNESTDIVVSSSVFEHLEMFWVLFLEVLRILKPTGLFYLSVPSNGSFHRYPIDCWRFYPDSGAALVQWAHRNGFDSALMESFTARQERDYWNDFVAVFVKDKASMSRFPRRMLDTIEGFTNARLNDGEEIVNFAEFPEDLRQRFHLIQMLRRPENL